MKDGAALGDDPAVAGLVFDGLASSDLVNLVLQRSEVLSDLPRPGRVIRAWEAGDNAPMLAQVERLGVQIARRAAEVIAAEYASLQPVLAEVPFTWVADIGCGYALFDLFLARDFAADLLLIDIETNDRRHFGFQDQGAAYASLAVARALLQGNGVAAGRIVTLNPARTDLMAAGSVDLAVSFLSCGFHYPVDSYIAFFTKCVKPGGRIILDLRAATADAQSQRLAALGDIRVLPGPPKARRVMVTKR
ncbi:MAG: class I SAM-dependent methyltransferase [Gemmobacter sp.]